MYYSLRMVNALLGIATLASLVLVVWPTGALAAAPTYTYAVGNFTTTNNYAPGLAPNGHMDTLTITGLSGTVTLTPGQSVTVPIETFTFTEAGPAGLQGIFDSEAANHSVTIGGLTETLPQIYSIGVGLGSSAQVDTIFVGSAFGGTVYNLGAAGTIGFQPVGVSGSGTPGGTVGPFTQFATFQFLSNPAPEPSTWAAFVFTGLIAAGLMLKARKRGTD